MEGWTWHLHTTVQNLSLGPLHVPSGLWIYISFSVKLEPLPLSCLLKDLSWWSGEIMDVKAFYKLWNIMWTVQHPEQGIIVCIYVIWTRKPLVFLLALRTLQNHFHFLLSLFLNDFHPHLQDGTPFVWLCLSWADGQRHIDWWHPNWPGYWWSQTIGCSARNSQRWTKQGKLKIIADWFQGCRIGISIQKW